jgi:hypothetical protein
MQLKILSASRVNYFQKDNKSNLKTLVDIFILNKNTGFNESVKVTYDAENEIKILEFAVSNIYFKQSA